MKEPTHCRECGRKLVHEFSGMTKCCPTGEGGHEMPYYDGKGLVNDGHGNVISPVKHKSYGKIWKYLGIKEVK
jgi:hypothetical protein